MDLHDRHLACGGMLLVAHGLCMPCACPQVALYDLRSPLGVPPAVLTPSQELTVPPLDPQEAPQYVQYMQYMQGAPSALAGAQSALQPMMSALQPATSVLRQLVLPPQMAAVLGNGARGSPAQQSLVAQYRYAQTRR